MHVAVATSKAANQQWVLIVDDAQLCRLMLHGQISTAPVIKLSVHK